MESEFNLRSNSKITCEKNVGTYLYTKCVTCHLSRMTQYQSRAGNCNYLVVIHFAEIKKNSKNNIMSLDSRTQMMSTSNGGYDIIRLKTTQ